MTLDQLAVCMRGTPRDTLILLETPEGLREVNLVKATRVLCGPGTIRPAEQGAYALVLTHDPSRPDKLT